MILQVLTSHSKSVLSSTDAFSVKEHPSSRLPRLGHKPNSVSDRVPINRPLLSSWSTWSFGGPPGSWSVIVSSPNIDSGYAPALIKVSNIAAPPLNLSILTLSRAVQAKVVAVTQVSCSSTVDPQGLTVVVILPGSRYGYSSIALATMIRMSRDRKISLAPCSDRLSPGVNYPEDVVAFVVDVAYS